MADPDPTWRRGDELSAAELYALLELRVDVFVVEQDCAYHETDGRDLLATTWHGWQSDSNVGIVAAVRLLGDEDPPRIGRVVTHRSERGQGLAGSLVLDAHTRAAGTGTALDAQSYLVDWYERLGWAVNGPEFIEDGIAHVPMVRRVEPSDS